MESMYKDLAQDVIVQYASLLNDWMPKDATIAIALEDTYIYYCPKIIDIHIEIGQTVSPHSIAQHVYERGSKIETHTISAFNQLPYFGVGYPITIQQKQGALIVILPPKPNHQENKIVKPIHFITGRLEDEWQPIPIEEVLFFESLNKKNWCYHQGSSYQTSLTMKELASRLPENFIRIHRSYIINIRNISKITRDFASNLVVIMKNDEQLPVSQSYVAELRKALEF
ncbi:MAG: LytTR family transcriptional regulator DNA-binding domain-containing protein [Kurthia sp.]|nr:LytTR family transcriptional regulator DNA-binding domain-containing protein [Candidatus Kurthia equi]